MQHAFSGGSSTGLGDRSDPSTAEFVVASVCIFLLSGGLFPTLARRFPSTWGSLRELGLFCADVGGALLLFAALRRRGRQGLWSAHRMVLAALAWLAIASLWSVRRVDSFVYTVRLLPTFGVWLAVATWRSPRKQLEAVAVAFGFGLGLTSVLWIWYEPYLDTDFGAMGVWNHRNFLGHAASIAMVASSCLFVQRAQDATRFRRVIRQALAGATFLAGAFWLYRSESKTPVFTFAAIVVVVTITQLAYLLNERRPGSARIVFGLSLVGLLAAVALAFPTIDKNSGSDRPTIAPTLSNLSNRTVMWRVLRHDAWDGFWTGYGPNHMYFEATDRIQRVNREVGFLVPHPHNGFLDALLEAGVVLVTVLFGLIAIASHRAWRTMRTDRRMAAALFAMITTAVTLNLTEPDFFLAMPPTFLLLLLGAYASDNTL